MISRETIDRVFETARVEEVIGEFVQLKKAGSNFKGLSPFSEERTPSFMVSPVKQIWKDFSTGKGGNVVSFLMEQEHYSYPEAIRYLAKKYNIEIDEIEQSDEQKQQADERESMFLVSEYARDYFHKNLLEDPQGKAIGLSYFIERGYTEETIKKFQLGYSLNEWEAFTLEAINKGYNLKHLESTGLTIVKQDSQNPNNTKQFDRFKGRVMFPIHSMSGRVLGFGGRILTNDKKAAKYLNSPDSDIYHKSNVLYGIHYAKQTIAREDNCYLVEGYTDTITLHQCGIENVVASSGTALTENQIRLVNRLTKNITILFDGDAAGIRASIRGIDLILEQGMNVRVLMFPDGDDPDSYAKKVTEEELKHYLENNSQDFINFKVSLLMEEAKNDPIKKAGLIRDIVISISKIPDRIQREVYIQECSRIMDISENVLFNELAQIFNKQKREASKSSGRTPSNYNSGNRPDPNEPPMDVLYPEMLQLQKTPKFEKVNELQKYEREIIKILLLYGNNEVDFVDFVDEGEVDGRDFHALKKEHFQNLVSKEIYLNLQEDEVEFTDETFKQIYYDVINQLNQNKNISVDVLVNHTNTEIASLVTNILMDDEKHVLSNWERKDIAVKSKESDLSKMVLDAIYNLRRVLIEEKINSLKLMEFENENQRIENLESTMNYTGLRIKIANRLNRVV
ncbi:MULTISPECIES: DNA primase [Flavobacteriaceae]|uniref:DNA primase n=2 Tax=Flavobacteriaceae TaxID=49546 RepID=A0A4Y8AP88_9FLAO|nr:MULTISPECIES: DNA primase [Flavobacteriaceae]TEW72455.1 DNA primase [Gramella jeungdoensis]GGK55662.1 DNA primase [Lutibacter litoralis]